MAHGLFQQHAQGGFAPRAPRLHIGENALEVANASRNRLHLADGLKDALQLLIHLREGSAQALLERALQLLIDGDAHLLELRFIFLPQHIEATFDGLAECQRCAVIGLHHFLDLGLRFGEAFGLRAALGSHALEQTGRQGGDGFVYLFTKRAAVFTGCRAILRQTGSKGVEALTLSSGHHVN